jgi:hypothetical protein
VTEAVVHVFEVVDVYEEDADEAVFAGGRVDGGFEQPEELMAIGEARQGVALGEVLELGGALGHLSFEEVCLVAGG